MRKLISIILIMLLIFSSIVTTLSLAYEEVNDVKEEIKNNDENINSNNTINNNKENNTSSNTNISSDSTINNTNNEINTSTNTSNITENKAIDEQQDKEQKTDSSIANEEENNIQLNSLETERSVALEDGTYYIKSKLNENMVFDVADNSKNNYAKIQLWEKSAESTDNQKFEISNIGNGYYKIIAKHSKKSLDIPGASTSNCTKIQQYEWNETDAQQWIIKDAGDGYYYIISKCNGLYLDIAGAIANNGVQVQIYKGNGSNAQKFKLEKEEEIKGKQSIEDGTYKIKVADTNMVFDIDGISRDNGAVAQIWEESDLLMKNQRFDVKYIGDGYYNIIAKHSGKALRVSGNRINVEQETLTETNNVQKWIIKDNQDETYSIINNANKLYLDVQNQNMKNGSKIIVNKLSNNSTQKFKLERVESEKSEQLIKNGIYQIVSGINNGKVLDIINGSYNDNANLQIWENGGSQQQKFEITYNDDGYYEIKNTNSGKNIETLGILNRKCSAIQQ